MRSDSGEGSDSVQVSLTAFPETGSCGKDRVGWGDKAGRTLTLDTVLGEG